MNRLRLLAPFIVVIGVGCSDVAVPDGTLVICADDDSCPDDLVCEPASRLCVRALVGDELTPPTATITPQLIGGPFISAGSELVVDFTFATAPLRAPTVTLRDEGVEVAAFAVTGADETWQAVLTTSTSLPEGRLDVVVTALDGRGLPRAFPIGFVEVDLTPPVIANVSFQRLPDPRKTPLAFDILDNDVIGPAIDVSLAFSVNERLSTTTPPAARFVGSSVPLDRDPAVENPVTFAVQWPAPVADGSLDGVFDIEVVVVDLAGNVTTEVLVDDVEIDATPPLSPDVETAGAVVLERAPWGRADAVGLDVYTVVGAADVVDDGDVVIVARDAEGTREIGRTTADVDGFGGVDRDFFLATGDLLDVFVAVGDGAGNMSPFAPVRDTRWIASPGGKIVGDAISNPHVLEALPILATQLQQGGVSERGAIDGVGSNDDDVLVTRGAGTFTAITSDDSVNLSPVAPLGSSALLVGAAVGHDPVRNITLLFGGSVPRLVGAGPNFGARNRCGDTGVNDVVIRRADGRFRRLSFPSTAERPSAMANASFAFDTGRNELVLVGRSQDRGAEMWSFDGEVFTQLCRDQACIDSLPDGLQDFGLAYDAGRQVLVAHGGGLGAATYEFDGARWSAVCGGAVAACVAPGGDGGLVYDDSGERVLWFDGAGVSAFDGAAWTSLCTDPACIASAPPARDRTTAVWDRRRQRLVTFGGDVRGGGVCNFASQTFPRNGVPEDASRATPPTADTWTFDGTLWQQHTTPTSPPARARHAMAWDDNRGTVLVVAGDDCDCIDLVRDEGFHTGVDEDAWEFDGTTWTRADLAPPVPAGFTRLPPVAMSFHSMVPSTATGGVLALSQSIREHLLLVKDGRFYKADATVAVRTFLAPMAATVGGDVFTIGESAGGDPPALAPVVRLEGQAFTPICDVDTSCGSSVDSQHFGYGAAHDGERFVAFGGARSANGGVGDLFSETATADTFTFTEATGFTTPCAGDACGVVPARRMRSAMSPTRNAGEVLLFGGSPGDNATWIFRDGTTWEAAPSTTTPPPRQDLLLVFDPTRAAVFMTGGTDDDPSNSSDGLDRERPLPASLDVVWEWSDEWHTVDVVDPEQDGRPSPRFGAAAAADPDGGITIHGGVLSPKRLFGGPPGGDPPRVDETWSWDSGADRSPAQRFRVATTAAGLRTNERIAEAIVRWYGTTDDNALPSLLLWDGAAYVALSATSCGTGCAQATLSGGLTRRSLVGRARELIVVARAPNNGVAPHRAEVRTDFVEVALVVRRE